jgi:hypothetical protein
MLHMSRVLSSVGGEGANQRAAQQMLLQQMQLPLQQQQVEILKIQQH